MRLRPVFISLASWVALLGLEVAHVHAGQCSSTSKMDHLVVCSDSKFERTSRAKCLLSFNPETNTFHL